MAPSPQIKVKKADNDLLIEQLREVFRVLAADKVPVTKLDKRLDDVAHKWDEVKKLQPQAKGNVEPVQVGLSSMRWEHRLNQWSCLTATCSQVPTISRPLVSSSHQHQLGDTLQPNTPTLTPLCSADQPG